MVNEPSFATEMQLEIAIAEVIHGMSKGDGFRNIVLRGFGLDLAVFATKTGIPPRVCFFEVKAFAEDHGRCGFGNGRGEGNQIRLLFDEKAGSPREQAQLGVFDQAVRWIVGNRSEPVGSSRFLFLTSTQVQDCAMGGVKPGKQNNLRLNMFSNQSMRWPELTSEIQAFVRGGEKGEAPSFPR